MSRTEPCCTTCGEAARARIAFERQALADLAELKTEMHLLLGDGQPGRIQTLERRVERHEALVQRAAGIGALAGFMTTMLHVLFDYLKARL